MACPSDGHCTTVTVRQSELGNTQRMHKMQQSFNNCIVDHSQRMMDEKDYLIMSRDTSAQDKFMDTGRRIADILLYFFNVMDTEPRSFTILS